MHGRTVKAGASHPGHCIDGRADAANRQITDALGVQDTGSRAGGRRNRSHRPRPWPFPPRPCARARCARTYSGRRPGRADGRRAPSAFHGRPRTCPVGAVSSGMTRTGRACVSRARAARVMCRAGGAGAGGPGVRGRGAWFRAPVRGWCRAGGERATRQQVCGIAGRALRLCVLGRMVFVTGSHS
jgi:hypothetical protein